MYAESTIVVVWWSAKRVPSFCVVTGDDVADAAVCAAFDLFPDTDAVHPHRQLKMVLFYLRRLLPREKHAPRENHAPSTILIINPSFERSPTLATHTHKAKQASSTPTPSRPAAANHRPRTLASSAFSSHDLLPST